MKTVYICPVCGEKISRLVMEYLSKYSYCVTLICKKCINEVLPLATPQKEE